MLARRGVAVNREGAELYVNTTKPKETDVIFFVRHARRPERSWYTLDICMTGSEPREVQLHGYRNEWCGRKRLRIPPKVREFCDRWKKEVLLPWAAADRQKRKERKTA